MNDKGRCPDAFNLLVNKILQVEDGALINQLTLLKALGQCCLSFIRMTESCGQQSDQLAPNQQMSTQDVEKMVLSHATNLT